MERLADCYIARVKILDKNKLLVAIVEALSTELHGAVRSQEKTQVAATHEESKAENDKDTRAIESSYLARGQARRVIELGDAVASLSSLQLRDFSGGKPVAVSALVEVAEEDVEERKTYFLAPAGGGLRVTSEGTLVALVSPSSPLGRALLGRREGDELEVDSPQGARELSVTRVC